MPFVPVPAPTDVLYELAVGPFGPRDLSVALFKGREEMNGLYWFDVHFRFLPSNDGDLEDLLLGQPGRLVMHHDGGTRAVDGIITAVESQGVHRQGGAVGKLRLMPRMARLHRARTSRVFQGKTVVEIVTDVLWLHGVEAEWGLANVYPARAYCVQYQESDYEFVTRLLAEEGIMFFFRQPLALATDPLPGAFTTGGNGERLLLLDDAVNYLDIPGDARLKYLGTSQMQETEGSISSFAFRNKVGHESVLLREYDYRRPLLDLAWQSWGPDLAPSASDPGARVYEHHVEYESPDFGRNPAPTHLEQHRARLPRGTGTSSCRRLTAGYTFALEQHDQPHLNAPYALTRVDHDGYSRWVEHPGLPDYIATFRCVPASVPFRPPRPARPPRQVMETAVVVGPASEDIHTDQLGRIKVQFHWDLAGAKNEYSSCFIRVVQAWAGAGWGFQFIPRIGMEVLVSFIGGDLDNPVVVGALHNAVNPPTFPLPASRERSGIRTQSTPGGAGYNELSFNDAAGAEEIYLRAQRDLDEVVEHDHTLTVKGDQSVEVGGSRSEKIEGDRKVRVDGTSVETVSGDRKSVTGGSGLSVVNGDLDRRVGQALTTRVDGAERRDVGGASDLSVKEDLTVRVRGCHTTIVGKHDARRSYAVHVEGVSQLSSTGVNEIVSEKGVLLRCGKSSIRLTADKIELSSPSIALTGVGAALSISEEGLTLRADDKAILKAAQLLIQSAGASIGMSSELKLDGSKILLNSPASADDPVKDPSGPPTEIALVDGRGKPLSYQRFVLVADDGDERSGFLDKDGMARVDADDSGQIAFPDLRAFEKA